VFHEEKRRVIQVPARRLDDLIDVSGLTGPVVAKIDTQGAEHHIYRGGRQVFARADVLLIEFWPYGIERMGGDPRELISTIARDYSHGSFLKEGLVPTRGALREIKRVAAEMAQLVERTARFE